VPLRRLLSFTILCCLSTAVAAQEISLRIEDVVSPPLALHGIEARIELSASQPLTLRIGTLVVRERTWRDVQLRCARTRIASDVIECRDGVLRLDAPLPLEFSYRPGSRELRLSLRPASGERWQLSLRARGGRTLGQLRVENGALARLNPLLGPRMPQLSGGRLTLDASWTAGAGGRGSLRAQGRIAGATFSDPAGLHAGENLGGEFTLHAMRGEDPHWSWEANAAWSDGEVFWQPFYLAPARRTLAATGDLDDQSLTVRQAALDLEHIGTVQLDARWSRQAQRLESLNAEGAALSLGGVYESFFKPLWLDRLPGQLAMTGQLTGRVQMRAAKLTSLDLDVRHAAVRHENGLFDLNGLDLHVPWRGDGPGTARASVSGGQIWGVPLGAFSIAGELGPDSVRVNHVAVPVLDGRLNLDGLLLTRSGGDWHGEASAALQPVSMDRLSTALQWPQMHGTLSGVIPRVSYDRQALVVDGALLFRVFDGTAVVKDLRVADLLSRASRAYASVDMRGLDLDLLTRAFSFGSMQGQLDVSVQNLELANWRPVRFDARVASSPGDYPRRISQRAVENIAALGGASAAAALQRTSLRFFQEFRYDRIGLACRLERNVCTMRGIEDVNDGYLIVKGGGIPAISVIGYNRHVGWNELLARLARIRQAGVKPVVQ
jgi:hypothetical protein